jgi:ubiquinone/menaquinone biosynthesis C-methylase UbiE
MKLPFLILAFLNSPPQSLNTMAFNINMPSRPSSTIGRFGDKVYLDYICGIGDSTKELEFELPRTGDAVVVGMDPNPVHIRLAQKRFPELNFVYGNLPGMRLPKNQFDFVQMKRAFLTIKNKEKHIDEIYKVLKPKGTLLVVDYTLEHPYIQELRSVEVPLSDDIINYHPMAHHALIQKTFDDWTDSWEQDGMSYNCYVKY